MSVALPAWLPGRRDVANELATTAVVGATLYVFDGSFAYAVAGAAGFLLLQLVTDIAESAIGDYADNALFGLLVLTATGYAAVLTTPLWILVAGVAVGGWMLLDGIQHLSHGVARDEVGTPFSHEGSALTGLARALLARLLEPFRL